MLKIYLARHGQDEDNSNGILNGQRDKPLTEIGRNQAKELAEKIQKTGLKFEKIYSSPLKRAYQTAQTISSKLNMDKPQAMSTLKERFFGIHDGMLLKDIPETFGENLIAT